jgi:hypothetical protein
MYMSCSTQSRSTSRCWSMHVPVQLVGGAAAHCNVYSRPHPTPQTAAVAATVCMPGEMASSTVMSCEASTYKPLARKPLVREPLFREPLGGSESGLGFFSGPLATEPLSTEPLGGPLAAASCRKQVSLTSNLGTSVSAASSPASILTTPFSFSKWITSRPSLPHSIIC